MQQLAKVTGIPRITISRVINGYPHVSERMRQRVMEGIERYGYEANIMARSLVMQKTGLLALIVPDIRTSFYSRMIDRVEREALAKGLDLLPFNSFFDIERERHLLTLIRRLQVDALVIAPITANGNLVNDKSLAHFRKPVVFFDRYISPKGTSVLLNNTAAGKLAAEHLISLGHRRLAMLESSEDPYNICVRNRREGFARAIRKHSLPFNQGHLLRLNWPGQSADFDYGYALAKAHLNDLRSRGITALFAYTDSIALGAMRALQEDGVRVPEDISVVGCDDLDFSAFARPALTTICQPVDEMAKILVQAVQKRNQRACTKITPLLVERDSCSPAK